jgi:hypothetical protein
MAKGKVIKSVVVAFRLTPEEHKAFTEAYAKDQAEIQGVRSASEMARKLSMDYAHDRLRWRSEKFRKTTVEVESAAPTDTPA